MPGPAAERDPMVKAVAKKGLRLVGMATSPVRALPDFIIIGGKRCGTTSVFRNLSRHPGYVPLFPAAQKIKGPHFFDTHFDRGMTWYRSHFPPRSRLGASSSGVRFTGESSPYYLFHPQAPKRAARHVPDAKLIVLLRNPADRAFSHYRERVRHGAETLSFEDALDAEKDRLAGEEERILKDESYASWTHEHQSYQAQGRYARSLERWLEHFPRRQFLFVRSEDLFETPRETYGRITDFLGVEPLASDTFEHHNFHPGDPMDPSVRKRLEDAFADDNERLARMLDLDLSAWSSHEREPGS